MATMQQVGRAIKQRRLELKMTQAALAEAVDLTQVYISDIERGKATNAGIETLESIARKLNTSLISLLTENAALSEETAPPIELPPRWHDMKKPPRTA